MPAPTSEYITYYRNYSSGDNRNLTPASYYKTDPLVDIDFFQGWASGISKPFLGWCDSRDGYGIVYNPGDLCSVKTVYAAWGDTTKYITIGKNFTVIANAIRAKGGGFGSGMSFPSGFVSAISNIPAEDPDWKSKVLERTFTSFEDSTVSEIGSYAFAGCSVLSNVSFPECIRIHSGAFQECQSLTAVSFSKCILINDSAFKSCSSISYVSFPVCSTICQDAFAGCCNLTSVSLPVCSSIEVTTFQGCTSLQTVTLNTTCHIGNSAFLSCVRLVSLYLLGNAVCILYGGDTNNAFNSTPIGGYSKIAGQFGSVYVPQSLLTAYHSASGWSMISDRIVAIGGTGGSN